MERLTNKREADAQRIEYERRVENGYPRNIPEERFLKLAAYEDTGLTPSEVLAMKLDMAVINAIVFTPEEAEAALREMKKDG